MKNIKRNAVNYSMELLSEIELTKKYPHEYDTYTESIARGHKNNWTLDQVDSWKKAVMSAVPHKMDLGIEVL